MNAELNKGDRRQCSEKMGLSQYDILPQVGPIDENPALAAGFFLF